MEHTQPIDPLPVRSLQLGRLVLDTTNPNQHYLDPVVEPEVTFTSSSPARQLLASWRTSDFQAWFENACRQQATRLFLEDAYACSSDVDLVVGLRTMKPGQSPVAPEGGQRGDAELVGESIVAIVYCHVRCNRFPAWRVNNDGKTTNVWTIDWKGSGAEYGIPSAIWDEDAYFLGVYLGSSSDGWVHVQSETQRCFVNFTVTEELPLSDTQTEILQMELERLEMLYQYQDASDPGLLNPVRTTPPVPALINTFTLNCPKITIPPLESPNEETVKLMHDSTASPTVSPDHSWAIWVQNGKSEINFPLESQRSFANDLKGGIKDLIHEPINWWPFAPRR